MSQEQERPSVGLTLKDIETERRLDPKQYTMGDVGFVEINGCWIQIPYTDQGFRNLALKWRFSSKVEVLALNRISISDELAFNLPRSSSGHQIGLALLEVYSPVGDSLRAIFPRPKEVRHQTLQPNTKYTRTKDDFLYNLIIVHLESHLRMLASADSIDPVPWGKSFEKLTGQLADTQNAQELSSRTASIKSKF